MMTSFDNLQAIWDSQEELKDQVDKDVVHQWVKIRNRSFKRFVGLTEIVMTLTLLFVAGMFFKDPLIQGHDRILMVAGVASLMAAAFVWTGRIARKKREVNFANSLVGMVEQSIDAIDYQSRRMRSFIWWFAGPMSLGLLIGLFIVDESKRYLLYGIFIPAFAICMGLAYWQMRREIQKNLLPERSRLIQLRDHLMNG